MPDITKTLEEIDRLHARSTPVPWSVRGYCDVVHKNNACDADVLSTQRRADADLVVALHNAYPTLRSHIAELERKERCFDAIASGVVGIGRNGTNYRQWCAWSQSHGGPDGKTCIDTDLLTAVEAAIAAKETK